jgi:acetyl-CoA acetyltransferase
VPAAFIVGSYAGLPAAGGRSCLDLATSAALGALADAGLSHHDVDAVFMGYPWEEPTLMPAVSVAERLGIEPRIADTVSLGGASPAGMVARATSALESGACEVAVVLASSTRASGIGRERAIEALRDVVHHDAEAPFGAYIPALYALAAQRHMEKFGTTSEQMAMVACNQRRFASTCAAATMKRPLAVRDVLASKVIASPLHLFDCCLVTDFSGAVVMTADDGRTLKPPVAVAGWGESHSPVSAVLRRDLEAPGAARRSADAAYARAGLGPSDIDFAELYDSFTITVLVGLEALGFCAEGGAGAFVEAGNTGPGGPLPVNTHGGMLSYGTGGIYHLTEAVAQLRGERNQQDRPPRTGVVTGIGGFLSSFVTVVLTSETSRPGAPG